MRTIIRLRRTILADVAVSPTWASSIVTGQPASVVQQIQQAKYDALKIAEGLPVATMLSGGALATAASGFNWKHCTAALDWSDGPSRQRRRLTRHVVSYAYHRSQLPKIQHRQVNRVVGAAGADRELR